MVSRRLCVMMGALVLGLVGAGIPVHASGVMVIPPDKPSASNTWSLRGDTPLYPATLIETQVPGCMEGPCPVDLIAVFGGGHTAVLESVAPVAQVVQITTVQYVVATGLCQYGGCELGAYAVNRQRSAVAPLLVRAHIDFTTARCGLSFAYAGGAYTLKPVATHVQGISGPFYPPMFLRGHRPAHDHRGEMTWPRWVPTTRGLPLP